MRKIMVSRQDAKIGKLSVGRKFYFQNYNCGIHIHTNISYYELAPIYPKPKYQVVAIFKVKEIHKKVTWSQRVFNIKKAYATT